MTPLHEIPTPLTDAFYNDVRSVSAPSISDFARDLERKLALCRDALERIQRNAEIAERQGRQGLMPESSLIGTVVAAGHTAKSALADSEPKP